MSAPTFSYAQAAKGRASAPASSPGPVADSHNKDDASSVTTAPDASAKTFSTTSEVSESVKSSQIDSDLGSKKPGENGSVESISAPAKEDAITAQETLPQSDVQSANDSSARPPNRASEQNETRKGRKGKKGRTSEKEAEAAIELEKEKEKAKKDLANLVESAPPSVNIWQQRAEAKAKQPNLTAIIAAADSKPRPSLEISTKTTNNPETAEARRASIKAADSPRVTPDPIVRKARGNRGIEKTEQTPAPSSAVADVTSWPTPDTVAAEDGKRKAVAEPDTKESKDDGTKAARTKRDYVKFDITPTVVFQTPLPQRTAAKPRGAGQAGRGSGRGHSASLSLPGERSSGPAHDVPTSREGGMEPQGRLREDVRAPFPPSEKNKKFTADQLSQRKHQATSGARGSGAGDFAPKNETSKASATIEPTAKKDAINHHNSKPKRGGAHANGRGAHNGQQPFISNGNGAPRGSTQSPNSYGAAYSQQFGSGRGRGSRPGPGSNGFKGPANGLGSRNSQHHQQLVPEYNQFPTFNQAPFPPNPATTASSHEALFLTVLQQQTEFYFSDENLYNDIYLRQKMDAQGFVALELIAGFNRLANLIRGDFSPLRIAVAQSQAVEYVLGDGKELLRRRGDWQKFVINGSSNPGPTQVVPVPPVPSQKHTSPSPHYYQPMPYQPQYNTIAPGYGQVYPMRDIHPAYMHHRPQFSGNGAPVNGHLVNDHSPLNVSAPVFSPIHPSSNGFAGHHSPQMGWEEQTLKEAEIMPDSDIPKLRIMILKDQNTSLLGSGKPQNGSTELATPIKTNGIHVDSESPTKPEDRSTNGGTTSPAYIALNGDIVHVSDNDNNEAEAYVDLHKRAIAQRKNATGELPRDMQLLYRFWADNLPIKFNSGIYKEFRQCALDDAKAPVSNKYGYTSLVKFYNNVLSQGQGGRGPWPANSVIYNILQSHLNALQRTVDESPSTANGIVE